MLSIPLLLSSLLSGCGSLSGLDGKSEFACRAPDGVVCTSVSGVYANSLAGVLPAQRDPEAGKARPRSAPAPEGGQKTPAPAGAERAYGGMAPAASGPAPDDPLLSAPRVLRLWMAPWVDEDGDLHGESYLYAMWHRGDWRIEHTRRQIQRRYAPVTAPAAASSPSVQSGAAQARQAGREAALGAAETAKGADDDR